MNPMKKPDAGGIISYNPEQNPQKAFREAFILAKKAFKPVFKTEDNPFFKSKYADLASIHLAVDDALLTHGFTLHQIFESTKSSNYLLTKLCHIGGYEEISRLRLDTKDNQDPQKMKSAATYFRRIQLEAILGIAATEDDDGNHAAQTHGKAAESAPRAKSGKEISPAQAKRFYAIMGANGWTPIEATALLKKYGYDAAEKIQWTDYDTIIKALERGPASRGHKDYDQPPPHNDEDIPF